jgi:hypothetical protein
VVTLELSGKDRILSTLKTLLRDMRVESWYDVDYDEGETLELEVLEVRGFYQDIPIAVRCEEASYSCDVWVCAPGHMWDTHAWSRAEPEMLVEKVKEVAEYFKKVYKEAEVCRSLERCDCNIDKEPDPSLDENDDDDWDEEDYWEDEDDDEDEDL